MDQTFDLFPKLPSEIRRLIWYHTLPEEPDKGTIYQFDLRWALGFMTTQPGDPVVPELEALRAPPLVQVTMPTAFFVCREARAVADLWLKRQKELSIRFREETQGHIIVREYDPERDAMYVGRDMWDEFLGLMEGDWRDRNSQRRMWKSIKNLALPAFTAYYSISNLAFVLRWAKNLQNIYVIWDKLPKKRQVTRMRRPEPGEEDAGPQPFKATADIQPRWDISSYPDIDDTVRMLHEDPDTGREFVEEADLEEWVFDMDGVWMTTELEPRLVDDEGELKIPRVNVKVREVGPEFK
ncbi:hypothetical protein FALBO_17252 [Fusarium albosuccineum]|uniref:2EXR domain-containing protein n=1 Tax=Fusarium albosuccineum TaxID=1237068 RepID=A0A8H4K2Z6_9HYPO|nr:hypothetical protein FALBO_17252 [Fusarium albosuccineum]